jgi:hypothetical protein
MVADPLPAVALTMPYAPPAITMAAATTARCVVDLWKNMRAFPSSRKSFISLRASTLARVSEQQLHER